MSLSYHELRSYDLWKAGYDTFDIANLTGRSEAVVLREINQARSALLDKRYPYAPHHKPGIFGVPKGFRARHSA
ncbi:MAG TPA: hypothetical protein VFJ18_12260 [Pararhizobium sp.]|nr:hypothetical protein [Pararhizobium sp.]